MKKKNNIVQLSNYINPYLIYEKKSEIDSIKNKTIIVINKKLVDPYNIAVIQKKFDPNDFDIGLLGDYLTQNNIKFIIFLPLINTKGFYKRYFPQKNEYLDHYEFDDDKNFLEKRDLKDFEFLDIFNKKIIGLHGNVIQSNLE